MNSMFKYLTCILAFLIYSTNAFSQYTMTNGTINDCSGSFTDSGNGGNYGDNENFTYTICSDGSGGNTHAGLVFEPIANTILPEDILCVYDGNDVTAPLIFCSNTLDAIAAGAGFLAQASAVNPSGCLTITFVSDGAGNGAGWNASIVCNQQCQTITANIANSSTPIMPVDTGYIDLCPGEILVLEGEGFYPQNNIIYAQSDNTSSFEWDFGDGNTGFGPNIQHIYNEPGGYIIQLTITDDIGCNNTNYITQRVRVSGPPTFNIDPDISNVVCTNDTIAIYTAVNDAADISIQPGSYGFQAGGSVADSICIPDNDGTIYESTLGLGSFSPGQTLNDVNDIIGICIDIEHSYIGDLEIKLICPDGTVVVLQDYGSGGGGTYLGTPFDNDATACQGGPIGQGGTYCWTPNATDGTWGSYNGPTPNGSLPEGDYEPSESLNAFVGCPLNGEWILTIEDYLGIDDGVIFSWELVLNENIFPNLEVFDLAIVDANWVSDPSIIVNTPDSMIAVPQNPGAINYIFEATDDFGCVYDTTVLVNVLPQTDPACYTCSGNLTPLTDVTICNDGENIQLATALENVDLTTTTFQDTPNAPFNFTNTPPSNPLESTIAISGLPYNFIDIGSIESICMNLTHPSDLDVVATLVAPNGTSVQLTSGGAIVFGQNYTGTCFSLDAVTPINTVGNTPPYTGDWLPDGDLTTLVGSQANGNWTLQVADQYPGFEGGVLNNWSMTFNLANNLVWTWNTTDGLSCTDCPDPIVQPTVTTTYDLEATDQYGCVFNESFTVTVIDCDIPCTLVASLAGTTDASCSGAADGTATISATGPIGAVTYVLDGGTVTQIDNGLFTGLLDGPHQVILTDANNCTETIDFTINTPNPMSVLLTPTNISCNGQNDGTITAVANGGDSNFSYDWGSSLITATISNLAANTYTVIVTDGNGCTVSASEIITESDALILTTTESPVACFGGNDGSSTVGATGGVGSFTYLWSDAQTTATAVDLVAGTYTVTVTDNATCTATIEAIITEPLAALEITSVSQTFISCAGENGGEATVVATGGTGIYSYIWAPSGGGADVETGLAPGTYTVIVSDENLCSTTATVDIIESNPVVVSTSGTDLLCSGDNSGTVTAIATGGTESFTYIWSDINAQTNATATGLDVGTYTVTATDTNNCTATSTVAISAPTLITIQLTPTDISCNSFNDGEITALASGANGSYSYLWNNGLPTAAINNLTATTYTVTATDGMGCTASMETTLNEPTAISLTTLGTDVNCFGGNDGTANVVAIGGNPPYDYLWSDNQTTIPATNLIAGIYTVTVTDANLCTMESSVTIAEPIELTIISISQTAIGCFASNSGEATVVTSGGTGAVTYNWSPSGENSNIATGLATGIHTVIVTDENLCTATATVDIIESNPVVVSTSGTDLLCFEDNSGTVTAGATGGSESFTYLWSDDNAQTNATATGLNAGTYTVTATDTNNCTATNTVIINEPASITILLTPTDISCNSSNDGEVTALASGGDGNYTYLWSNGLPTSTITGLIANTYTVIATDGMGCTASAETTLNEPTALILTTLGTNISCSGGNDGTANVVATGGNPPYGYLWSDNQTTIPATNLIAGTYTVTVTDANLCTMESFVTITEPAGLSIVSISQTTIGCFASNGGEATVVTSGGTGTVIYNWSPSGENSNIATGLTPGTHTVIITDENDCSITTTVDIIESTPVVVTTSGTDLLCFEDNSGTASAIATGGSQLFTYLWNDDNAQTTATATGLNAGTYTVTVTDTDNCIGMNTVTINEPTPITILLTPTDINCNGFSDGEITSLTSGGDGNYSYSWSNGLTTPNISNLTANSYTIIATDGMGCTASTEVTLSEPTILSLTITGINVHCFAGTDGETNVAVTGGIAPYNYLWNDPTAQTTDTATGLIAGTYSVTVTDANMCTMESSISIVQPSAALQISSITQTLIACADSNEGEAQVTAMGGTAPYFYNWTSGDSASNIADLAAGTYTVIITDSNGCTIDGTVDIIEYAPMAATATSIDATCFDGSNGFAEVTLISGGAGTGNLSDYTYLWSSNNQTTYFANNLSVGDHFVTITDVEGCTAIDTVMISSPTEVISSTEIGNVSCSNTAEGWAKVTADGGTAPYTYQWDFAAGLATVDSIFGLAPGGYGVTITDMNGCTSVSYAFINPILAMSIEFDVVNNNCNSDFEGVVTANVTGGDAPYTYIWSTGDTTTVNSIDSLYRGYYSVTITDANGCTANSGTLVLGSPELTIDVDVMDVTCFGDRNGSIVITAAGGNPPYTYSFDGVSFGDSNYLGGLFPDNYDVAIQDANGCITSLNAVLVGEPLELEAIIYPSADIINVDLGDSIQLGSELLNGIGNITYEWEALYDDSTFIGCNDCPFPIIYTLENDRYLLTATDANGCVDTADVSINVSRNRSIFVPSGFTPNGDNINDVLMAHGTSGTWIRTFKVFDRLGELVFRADGYQINSTESDVIWDGTFKGKPMNSGVFIWYLEVKHIDGRQESFEGNTTLLR